MECLGSPTVEIPKRLWGKRGRSGEQNPSTFLLTLFSPPPPKYHTHFPFSSYSYIIPKITTMAPRIIVVGGGRKCFFTTSPLGSALSSR